MDAKARALMLAAPYVMPSVLGDFESGALVVNPDVRIIESNFLPGHEHPEAA